MTPDTTCGASRGMGPGDVTCTEMAGHHGEHFNRDYGSTWERETPERCGQSLVGSGERYTCSLAAGHRAGFHLDTPKLATWSRAGDLKLHASMAHALVDGPPAVEVVASGRGSMSERFAQRPVSLQHDACGARLTVSHGGPGWTAVCVLDPHDAGDKHRALDGTQWEVSGAPIGAVSVSPADGFADLARYQELLALAAPSEDGALNLGPIVARNGLATNRNHFHNDIAASQADVVPLVREVMRLRRARPTAMPGDAVLRSALPGIGAQIDSMTAVFAELRDAVNGGRLAELERHARIVRNLVETALPDDVPESLPLPDAVNMLIEEYRSTCRALDDYR